jgi:sensor histidine kinase YesM
MPNVQDNIIPKILKQRWMWHAAFWVVYLVVTLPGEIRTVLTTPDLLKQVGIIVTTKEVALTLFIADFVLVLYTYLIVLWIYPRFFKTQQYGLFLFFGVLSALIIHAGIIKVSYLISPVFNSNDWWGAYLSGLSTFALFLFLITMLKFFKDSLIQQQLDNQRFREAKQAELDNLKAQLSPHFLFNTMNNFYGLAVAQSKQLPDLMLRLSDLMRYSLYGTNRETVPLKDEIQYLKNYIELEKIRLEDTLQLDFHDNTEGVDGLEIAPLILIVFVENAFKHSRNITNEAVVIKIKISVSATNWLTFYVENNYTALSQNTEGGIGLENVKRRLNVLYPNELHTLNYGSDGRFFKVNLTLKLH